MGTRGPVLRRPRAAQPALLRARETSVQPGTPPSSARAGAALNRSAAVGGAAVGDRQAADAARAAVGVTGHVRARAADGGARSPRAGAGDVAAARGGDEEEAGEEERFHGPTRLAPAVLEA